MKKSKFYLAILCVFAMVLSLAACSGPSNSSSSAGESSGTSSLEGKTITVGFSNWSKSFEFYVDLEKGMQEVADAEGVTPVSYTHLDVYKRQT